MKKGEIKKHIFTEILKNQITPMRKKKIIENFDNMKNYLFVEN